MPKRKSTEQVIAEFVTTHGDKYDYSLVSYVNSQTKVDVICKTHGEFQIAPGHHKNGVGCRKCYFESKKGSFKDFKNEASNLFQNRYRYDPDCGFDGLSSIIRIHCLLHQIVFYQHAGSHLRGHTGCEKCKSEKLSGEADSIGKFKTQEELNLSFIHRAQQQHGDIYDYSLFKYRTVSHKGIIVCPTHGWFAQSAGNHLKGRRCPDCSIEGKYLDTFKKECAEQGVNYHRALKRRQAGLSEDKVLNQEYIRGSREINPVTVFGETFPNYEEACRILDSPASPTTIRRWISQGMTPEEAFEKVPNPGYANGIIYLVTGIQSGKKYVGLTIQTLKRRWRYHCEQASQGAITSESSLHAAIREFGADQFAIEMLDRGTTKKDLESKEREWITKLGTLAPSGYNLNPGGTSGGSNKRPVEIDGIMFPGVAEASVYLAKKYQISKSAAKKRISTGRIHVRKPSKPGQAISKTPAYKSWSRLVHIDTNPKSKSYIPGLQIESSWDSFEKFLADNGQPPKQGMCFVRLDKTKGFVKGNCKWLTRSEASKINAQYMKVNRLFRGMK